MHETPLPTLLWARLSRNYEPPARGQSSQCQVESTAGVVCGRGGLSRNKAHWMRSAYTPVAGIMVLGMREMRGVALGWWR